ncbi:MAG: Cellobiose phosphorylase, partial [Ferruginibacter sp.]|nr:Cellobiose phosphorylase [Ferruginibacter sp.]
IDSFIGLKKEGLTLRFKPCIPPEWDSVKIRYRYKTSLFNIQYQQVSGGNVEPVKVIYDGNEQAGNSILLVDDGAPHEVIVKFTV